MKWFEHQTDALEHPKIKALIKEFGTEGYYVCFATWEKIGKYGDKYLRLPLSKYPKTLFEEDLRISIDKIEKIWVSMSKLSLLSSNSLKNNILYSSKLKERCDEYHKKLRRKSRQDTDKVVVDKNTTDKIILEYIQNKGWENQAKDKNILNSIYKRSGRATKELAILTNNLKDALSAIKWTAQSCQQKKLSWTLETVIAWYPDFLLYKKAMKDKEFKAPEVDCQKCGGSGWVEEEGKRNICSCRRIR